VKHPLRILIAEDNIVNQTLAIRALRKLGYEPELSENGKDAFDKIQRSPFDIIFMDIQMPEMDGFEATRSIRNMYANQHIIVAMTANAMVEDRASCIEAGMDDYISKPINFEELTDILKKWALHVRKVNQQTG
jgi:CheY-like chemotaxis protein